MKVKQMSERTVESDVTRANDAGSSSGGAAAEASLSTLVDEVAQKIQSRILSGSIPIGSWLRQESLATEFGVSRTPIREALRKLQASGIVEFVPNRGALVSGPTVRDIREAYEVRAELEAFAAELAARWIRPEQLDRLRDAEAMFRDSVAELVEGRAPSGSGAESAGEENWFHANTVFHEVVLEAAQNERLQTIIADLHRSFPRNLTWAALRENVRLLDENVAQHGRIREAIESGHAEAARREMSLHVRFAEELVTTWFERQLRDAQSRTRSSQPDGDDVQAW
jgi:DNA-binding GntR family transcriptional regulator